jgi:outer membrane protein assembly factor BamB
MARQFMPVASMVGGLLVVLSLLVGTNYVAAAEPAVECSLPPFDPRWVVPCVNDPVDEKLVLDIVKTQRAQESAALPMLRPLVIGDTVLTRTPTNLQAIDFRSGKRIWEFPWDSSERWEPFDQRANTRESAASRTPELQQRLWQDAPYNQISSDGELVFVLDGLGYAIPNFFPGQIMIDVGGIVRRRGPGGSESYNELAAVELSTLGKLRWKIGGRDGGDEPKLAGAFFLGAPLPVEGKLYVLAEIEAKIHLVVLDGKTGQQAWSLELLELGKRTILFDFNRRLAGAAPAFADGVVVCPTDVGEVIGVDAKNRSQLWRYKFTDLDAEQIDSKNLFRRTPPRARWADTALMVSNGRILVTPTESDDLHCIDLRNGNSLWLVPRLRGEMLFLAGIHGEHAILVGKHEVAAVKLSDGSAAWAESIKFEALPSGRGFLCGRHYFLPTTASELLKIDVAEGKIVERARTDRVLGYLVAYQDQIISHGADVLATYYQREPLRKRVAQSLKENPDDAEAMELQVKLLLTEGRQREALAMLQRARELRPQSVSIRTLFIRETLAGLRRDFAAYREAAATAEPLIDSPEQRAEYLRLLAVGLEGNGETIDAFHTLLKLNDLRESESRLGVDAKLEQVEPSLQSRNVRVVNASLARLRAAATAEERAQMDKLIQVRFDAAIKP